MKKIVLTTLSIACMLPVMGEQKEALADSSRVYDLDEVVVVSQNKEFMKHLFL